MLSLTSKRITIHRGLKKILKDNIVKVTYHCVKYEPRNNIALKTFLVTFVYQT